MAWNDDQWRLARETWDSTHRAAGAVERAGTAVLASDPELAQRLNRAMGSRGRDLAAATSRILEHGAELPTTEPEARRRIAEAQRFKTLFRQAWHQLAADARGGRHGLVTQDHVTVMQAGVYDAEAALNDIPWPDVDRAMSVPIPRPPAPVPPRDPTRPPRRGIGAALPLLVLAVFMFSSNRR